MNYKEALQSIDTMKALKSIGLKGKQQGAYVYFPCTECGQSAAIRAYGEKKNVWYCPKCKASGQLISLAMKVKETDWEEAKKFLLKSGSNGKRITKELQLNYELEYVKALEDAGLSSEFCKEMEVGKPKGKAMLSGCIAFTVHDEEGKRIAYYGKRIKDGKSIFHRSFNPEIYLFNLHRINPEETVILTTDMMNCLTMWANGIQAVCNFGLPYVSPKQIKLLINLGAIGFDLKSQHISSIAKQFIESSEYPVLIIKDT